MLDTVIRWSLAHRGTVISIWSAIAVLGILAFRHLPLDAFPDITPVQVQVNTVAPAMSPLQIERQVTFPVEQAISGLPRLVEVRSISKFGLSQVTVLFEDGTDVYFARQVVSERLQSVELPPGLPRPQLGPVATGLGEIFHYLVTSKEAALSELRSVQDWIIRPQLRSVPGVAEVNSWGGDERQLQVVLDPTRLVPFGLSLEDVARALETSGSAVGGGSLDNAGESVLVQGVGLLTRKEDILDVVIDTREGIPIRIRDIGDVVEGREIRRGAVTAEGRGEAVLGLAFMLVGENSREITRRLALRLSEIRRTLPRGIDVTVVYERTWLVDQVLETVRRNLLEGALLVVAVLFVFLGDLRAGLIVASAIPLSMLFAFSLMERAGIAGSLMSLGAIDFGLVVDSSVIMVENAMRRLGAEDDGRTSVQIVEDAAIEVRRPTMFGELIIAVVYLPILALIGIEGKLFRPMALTVIFALLGSMALSLTLVPVLSSFLLRRSSGDHARETLTMRVLKALYRPLLIASLRLRWQVLTGALIVVLGAGILATRLGSEFVPRLLEGTLVINTVRLAGVSIEESVRYGSQIEKALLAKFPDEIERVWTRTGTAEVATDPMGLELSDVFVMLRSRDRWRKARTQTELVSRMSKEMEGLPGMRLIFTQPIEMRVNEMVAGIRSDVGIKIFGDDLDVLKRKAREIESILKLVPGAADVSTETVTGQSLLSIEVDRVAASRFGIPAQDILRTVEALGTRVVGQLQEGERRFPITLRIHDRYRHDPASLGRILVSSPRGDRVPLARVTRMSMTEGPSTVSREWARRRVIVQANVRDRDIGSFVTEVKKALAENVELPAGYFLRFGGQFEHLEKARERLLIVVPLALALILALLHVTYGRWLDALRVFSGVPFAVVGGVTALWLRDLPFSISAAVGFIALSGVSVLGDMVLVSTLRVSLDRGLPLREAILGACEERLRPVLMTALVASLGFVPMAFHTGIGAEVQRPLATVVIGGVVSSTLLTLLVLPVLYTFVPPKDS